MGSHSAETLPTSGATTRQSRGTMTRHRRRMIDEGEDKGDGVASNEGNDSTSSTVHLVTSGAYLLSGDLDECTHPQDPSCEGGIASVAAFARHLIPSIDDADPGNAAASTLQEQRQPMAFAQKFDKKSTFVNTHELQWVVNRLVLHDIFGLDFFISNPSLLLQNAVDADVSNTDISGLQTEDMPLLLSNSQVPPSSSWYRYAEAVHFDEETGLAIANIADEDVPLFVPQVDAAKGILNAIAKINRENGCYARSPTSGDGSDDGVTGGARITTADYQAYLTDFQATIERIQANETAGDGNTTTTTTMTTTIVEDAAPDSNKTCWLSVILYQDGQEKYDAFLDEISKHLTPPDFVLNLEDAYESYPTPQLYLNTTMWVGTCPMDDDVYCQHSIATTTTTIDTSAATTTPSKNRVRKRRITDIQFIERDLEELPHEFKDDQWDSHIVQLHQLAKDAQSNNPITGYTSEMPAVRDGQIRYCQAGECPIGNLFTDALRWYTDTDIAFVASGGFRGEGWPAGPVRLTDIYGALPFPNTECIGTMSGLSLFRMLEYVTRIVPFDVIDTDEGAELLQVSGMKITYNDKIEYGQSRLISVKIWNRETNQYEDMERLKLYTFVTDSYLCGAYNRYPEFTGSSLTLEGEKTGVIGDDQIVQNVVAFYLGDLPDPYDTGIQGRLQNDEQAFTVLDFLQSEDSCPKNTVWDANSATCLACPNFENVAFSDELMEFEAENNSDATPSGRIVLVNREAVDVSVLLKSRPRWLEITNAQRANEKQDLTESIQLAPGENMVLNFDVFPSNLLASGTDRSAIATVNFGVLGAKATQGCTGLDVTFDVALRVTPPDDLNNLGWIRYVGFALFGIIGLTATALAIWVFINRQARVVKILQPVFLMCVLMGVLILSSAIIPLSIDDEIASIEGCDIACMSIPWLLSSGFIISFCALFCKLWRINRLFNGAQRFRRVVVKMRNVVAPFIAIFALNIGTLIAWTVVDPWTWERKVIDGQKWNTYGSCQGGEISIVLVSVLGGLNLFALVLSCHQAYIARKISDEFSESSYIGIAVYGWLQIFLIGGPILLLIDEGDPTARYFIEVAIIFTVSMSMLLLIFVPGFINKKRERVSIRNLSSRNSSIHTFQQTMKKASGDRSHMAVLESMGNTSTLYGHDTSGEITMKGQDYGDTNLHMPAHTQDQVHSPGEYGGSSSDTSTNGAHSAASHHHTCMHMQSIQEVEESSESDSSLDPVEAARVRKRELEEKLQATMHQSVNKCILGMESVCEHDRDTTGSSEDGRGTDKTVLSGTGDDSA